MFCTKCGSAVSGNFCNKCGTPVSAQAGALPQYPVQQQAAPANLTSAGMNVPATNKSLVIIITVVVIAVLAVFGAVIGIVLMQKNKQENINAITNTLDGYASAMSRLDFDRAADFWHIDSSSKAKTIAAMLKMIPQGDKIQVAMSLADKVVKVDYIIPVDSAKVNIKANNATVYSDISLQIGVPISTDACEIVLEKINGEWCIISIKKIK